jgi:hypothetical protein
LDCDKASYLSYSCGSCIPFLVGVYVVAGSASYERGFGAPLHRFLLLLLQFYGLELHHLTPLGFLHIVAFITLCEAYIGTEPHFNLWNYFFRIWLRQGPGVEAAVWGCVDISIRCRQGIDPYSCLSMSNPPVGWQREWFFLRNDTDTPLHAFTGNRPTLNSAGGMVWLGGTSTSYNPYVRLSSSCNKLG